MKIAFVSDVLYPQSKGGSEKRLWEIAKRLAKKNEVHVYTLNWKKENVKKIVIDDVCVHFVGKGGSLYTVKGRRPLKEAIKFMLLIFKHLNSERFDIIDCNQSPMLHCFSGKIAAFRKNPLILTLHEIWMDYWHEYMNGKLGVFGQLLERLILSFPNAIITPSELTKRRIINLNRNFHKIQIHVIPNGINFNLVQACPKHNEEYDVIYTGRLIDSKKVNYLLKAISITKRHFPYIKCAIVGDGPKKRELEQMSKKLGISKNVKFFGYLEDESQIFSLMKAAKIFVSCSIREGFGLTFLEANACALPVIGVLSEENAANEIIINGVNGLLVEPEPTQVAKGIVSLLGNDKLRNEMGLAGKLFAQKFDWDKIADITYDVYNKLIHQFSE